MLGWFKKKFGKQTEPEATEPELAKAAAAEVVLPSPVADAPQTEPAAEHLPADQVDVAPQETIDLVQEGGEKTEVSLEQPVGEDLGLPLEPADAFVEAQPADIVVSEPLAVAEPVMEEPAAIAPAQEKPAVKSMFKRLQERLGKSKESFIYRLDRLFLGKKEIDQELFEQLEEILITADLGVATTLELLDDARKKVKRDQLSDPQALKTIIRDQILAYIEATNQSAELVMPTEGPFVIMVVGVNGVGKTTTIGKIAAKFVRAGQSVLLVAGDTFRAAAINQLKIWGERVGVKVIAQNPGSDPSSVVFDALEHGVAHTYDVILIDTAGRLHTSVNLMEELKKIKRVIGKKMEGAPHEIMLVLDATTGQNSLSQVKFFHEAVGVTGLTLTKLDGTAKGGIVANVCRESRIPVRFIGIGEQLDDLRDFDAREFVDALFAGHSD
jgi:fused signal recognition particle receptor